MGAWRMPDLPTGSELVFQDDCCASCLEPLPLDVPGLFCNDLCSQVAKTVRYVRGANGDGRILDPDVRDAVRIRIAHLHAGGYDSRDRKLPEAVRRQVFERDRGVCVSCGAPGAEIDHIDGASADLANLQLLCTACHHAKTDQSLSSADSEQRAAVVELFERRINPVVPILLADDHERWGSRWRPLGAARRQRLKK